MKNGDLIEFDLFNKDMTKFYALLDDNNESWDELDESIGIKWSTKHGCFVIVDIDKLMLAKIKYGI
jgi:hypothetical protein